MQCWDAVIFDLDGTLWNPADGILAAWNRGFAAHGLAPFITKSHVEYWMGMLLPDIAAYILPDMENICDVTVYNEVINMDRVFSCIRFFSIS